MTDLSKVADLVLLMVDASYGFEMETFEFLNQLQLHGFPKVVGVLTHLDGFKVNKSLQKTKKALKHRFWTEIYDGAKMFDMSGVVNGKYPKHEVKRISLYISRTKFRPLVWRNSHPYVVVDRVEDVTPQQRLIAAATDGTSAECDRDVTLYGYVRGTHLQSHHRVHLIGVGDFPISALSCIDDPCHQPGVPGGGDLQERATLKKKDNLLYAPLANVGRVKIDNDGVYIELKTVHYTKKENLLLGDGQGQDRDEYGDATDGTMKGDTPADLLRSMQDVAFSLDQRMEDSELSLFKGSQKVKSSTMRVDNETNDDIEEDEDDIYEDDEYDEVDEEDDEGEEGEEDDEGEDDDDDEEEEEEEEEKLEEAKQHVPSSSSSSSSSQWKVGMQDRAASGFSQRASDARAKALDGRGNIMHTVYGAGWSTSGGGGDMMDSDGDSDNKEDDDDLFVAVNSSTLQKYKTNNTLDSNRMGQRQRVTSGSFFAAPLTGPSSSSSAVKGKHSSSSSSSAFFDMIRQLCVTGGADAWKAVGQSRKAAVAEGAGVNGDDNDNDNDNDDNDNDDDNDDNDNDDDDDDSVYGDFEDLQQSAESKDKADNDDDDNDDDDSVYGDFEDLQQSAESKDKADNDDDENSGEEEDEDEEEGDSDADSEADNDAIDKQLRESYAAKKSAAKSTFDKDYDKKKSKVTSSCDYESFTSPPYPLHLPHTLRSSMISHNILFHISSIPLTDSIHLANVYCIFHPDTCLTERWRWLRR